MKLKKKPLSFANLYRKFVVEVAVMEGKKASCDVMKS